MAATLCCPCRGTGSIPGQGTRILNAAWCGKNEKIKKNKAITDLYNIALK